MKKDLGFDLKYNPTKSLDVAERTASADGAQVDLKGFRSCTIVIDSDAYTDGTHTLVVNESDTSGASFTAAAAGDLAWDSNDSLINASGQVVIDATADGDAAHIIRYVGNKRYVRVELTVTSATSGAIAGALIFPGHKINSGKLNN